MTLKEYKEQQVANITGLLRKLPFTFEFKVVEKPRGMQVIYEVTQKQMDEIMKQSMKKGGAE